MALPVNRLVDLVRLAATTAAVFLDGHDDRGRLVPLSLAVVSPSGRTFSYGCPSCGARHRHQFRATDVQPHPWADPPFVPLPPVQTNRQSHCPNAGRMAVVHVLIVGRVGR